MLAFRANLEEDREIPLATNLLCVVQPWLSELMQHHSYKQRWPENPMVPSRTA